MDLKETGYMNFQLDLSGLEYEPIAGPFEEVS
jgi:hypothetical protein